MEVISKAYKDFIRYKDYIMYTTVSELKVQLSSTFLGYLWWILDPLMYMLVYMLVVMVIFKRGGNDFPIFVFSALVPWKWTVSSIQDSTGSIKGKAVMLQQVYIPKYTLPLIKVLINTAKFLFGIVVLLGMMMYFKIPFTIFNLGFIPILIVNFLVIMGISLILAHLGVYFKDINNILSFTIRLWFYLSPAFYSLNDIPSSIRPLWWLNPMTTFYQSYRNVFLYGELPLFKHLGVWAVVSLFMIVIGLKYLYKYDKNYTKVI